LPQLTLRTGRATALTFDNDYEAVMATLARRKRLDTMIEEMAADSEFTPLVRRLGCLRGIGTLTGFALAVEIGDWHRFTGNSIGSFVGLVPTERSSGESRSQGSITKTGNTHVRRLLVEAAWHHKPRYVVGKTMRDRWDLAPAGARIRGDEGNRRLRPLGAVHRPQEEEHRRRRRRRPRARRLVLVPSRPGVGTTRSASSTTDRGSSAWSDPRPNYEQPIRATLAARHADRTPAEQPVLR